MGDKNKSMKILNCSFTPDSPAVIVPINDRSNARVVFITFGRIVRPFKSTMPYSHAVKAMLRWAHNPIAEGYRPAIEVI